MVKSVLAVTSLIINDVRYITVADLTAMLVGVLEVISNDDAELDLIDKYAYPIANGNLVLNQGSNKTWSYAFRWNHQLCPRNRLEILERFIQK